ncbi:leucine-rich repeat domain-containing protein [Treponema denticola]
MTKFNSKPKAHAFLGAAFVLLIALMFTACPQRAKPKAKPEEPPPGPQKVTFSVEGTPANGELKAMAGSTPITSGSKVPYGTTVTFTATVTAAEHYADEWTIKGGSFKAGGKDGDTTATVQITGETEVKVNFSRYKSVAFGTDGADLAAYLNSGTPAADGIYYIKVTGLQAEHLKGEASHSPYHPSPLGKVLNDNPAKKVALKFGKLPAVTNMEACFRDCKNLTQAPMLPAGVTNLSACFYNCEGLTQAPEIPESVTNMNSCFNGCKNLIQVPAFPANAKVTNMNGCFVECENLTQVPSLPASVTDITNCFSKCKNLTQAPEIPASVTEMAGCFYGCEKLTQAPSTIPKGVTNLHSCFSYCRKLTKAPVIPKSVTVMKYCFKFCRELTEVTLECNYGGEEFFREAFLSCDKLTAGSIKVPEDQVAAYKAGADDMGTQPDRFVAAP